MQEPEASNTPMWYFPLRWFGITVQCRYSRKLRGVKTVGSCRLGFSGPE